LATGWQRVRLDAHGESAILEVGALNVRPTQRFRVARRLQRLLGKPIAGGRGQTLHCNSGRTSQEGRPQI
jgi:hypothetical protein